MEHSPFERLTRRKWLATGGAWAALASGALSSSAGSSDPPASGERAEDPAKKAGKSQRVIGPTRAEPFGYCFNTSTIRGQKLGLPAQIDVIADAGYSAAELWVSDIQEHFRAGRSLEDVGKRIQDRGLSVPSTISFFPWIADDAARRREGLEQAKREMDLVRRIGATRIAAPPAGAPESRSVDLLAAADRYRALLELGDSMGVTPQLELWGFSKSLSRVGEVAGVTIESAHPRACLLLDVYHVYKGGSRFESLRFLNGAAMHVIHMNDYPAQPGRDAVTDAHRVFPGDGAAPLGTILRALRDIGYRGFLSLEVFNREYWKQDPHLVARTGLRKMRESVHKAFG